MMIFNIKYARNSILSLMIEDKISVTSDKNCAVCAKLNSIILPLFDYADIVWGDCDNKVLMKSLQILQNKAAKVILHYPNRSSSIDALATLKWDSLEERRKLHRSSFVKKTLFSNVNKSNVRGNKVHTYCT